MVTGWSLAALGLNSHIILTSAESNHSHGPKDEETKGGTGLNAAQPGPHPFSVCIQTEQLTMTIEDTKLT